ncbi:MAG: hypothetical protein KFW09_00405 [Oscillospiraceae bacterium]|nr:hypothetical protein [Oscillospiraceae bacterium]
MDKKIKIFCGYYGSGKTNFAINYAINMKNKGYDILIIDLDIINPYYKIANYTKIFNKYGIEYIIPLCSNSTIDIPSLSPAIGMRLNNFKGIIIIDMGGDGAGSLAIGQYNNLIKSREYDMFYVFNLYRNHMTDGKNILKNILDIEKSSRLKVGYLINNSNIGDQTRLEDITCLSKQEFEIEKITNKKIIYRTINQKLLINDKKLDNFYPIDIYVKKIWE